MERLPDQTRTGAAPRHAADCTAIGSVVNLASRLCEHATNDEILLDRRAFLDAEAWIVTDEPRMLDLKGIGNEVQAFTLRALNPLEAASHPG